jgi:hypothetical protein
MAVPDTRFLVVLKIFFPLKVRQIQKKNFFHTYVVEPELEINYM